MMNSKSQRLFQTERGFTLLELLVAVFISALVLTLVGTSFFQIINAKEKVEDQLELIHEARVVFSRIGKDLSSVYPRGKVVNSAASYPYIFFLATNDEQTDNSRLEFSSFARRHLPRRCRPGSNRRRFRRCRRRLRQLSGRSQSRSGGPGQRQLR